MTGVALGSVRAGGKTGTSLKADKILDRLALGNPGQVTHVLPLLVSFLVGFNNSSGKKRKQSMGQYSMGLIVCIPEELVSEKLNPPLR